MPIIPQPLSPASNNPSNKGRAALIENAPSICPPLADAPLISLSMLGTVVINSQAYAWIKAPDKGVHRVSLGDNMVQNYGAITKIDDSEITLAEIVPDGFGGWTQRPASLALAQ